MQKESGHEVLGKPRKGARWTLLPLAALCLVCAAAAPSGDGGKAAGDGDVDGVRATLAKWVEVRRILSKEKRDWALGREILNERIGVVSREIEALRAKIAEAEASIAEADEKRAGLLEENERFRAASSALGGEVVALEARTTALLPRLPDPIRERVKPLSQRLPAAEGETKLSLAQRFENVVGILNEVNKFNREITVTSEVRTLGDGTAAEVAALYVGIGQAYYASPNGLAAGVGTASADGWVWSPANDAAGEIARAIAITRNEQVADFVRLPVRID
ncbi:MAG TPA: DUF3450 family protein [Planctomycetota bacterium]|nr:DUF3450 family protein [Planctomycetota bacterium]